ncbi:MAG: DivIVA domain-containing protein [Ignavibacteria bacterium]|nr:DivIVA domain-containing protein [Ignavibacteria bacterium]
MNNISSKEIKKNDFKKTFRGYDPYEVDAFLEALSLRFERLLEENTGLSSRINTLTSDIDVYKENEATLQRAIVKMQDLAEEMIQSAKKKAELIIREAEVNAQKLAQDTEKEIITRKNELEELKLRNDKLVEDVKLFFMEKLNEMDEFVKARNVYKMELSRHKHEFEEEDQVQDEEQSLRKISINTSGTGFSE